MKKEKTVTYLFCTVFCVVFWLAYCFVLTLLRVRFNTIFGILLIFGCIVICRIVKNSVHKHFHKDPDEQEAAKLGMSVTNYRRYKAAHDKIQALYKKYGLHNSLVNRDIDKIITSLPNKNEWRRFEEYKFQEGVDDMRKRTESLFNGTYDKDYPKEEPSTDDWYKEPESKYSVGDTIKIPMEDESTATGSVVEVMDGGKNFIVMFDEFVSLVPTQEPIGGYTDNPMPKKWLKISLEEIEAVEKGELIGTSVHYHF